MSVKFFGQFLIEHGCITTAQLREALDLMERNNTTLEALALELKFLDQEQIDALVSEQRTSAHSFEELVMQDKLLDAGQLNTLLDKRAAGRLRVGEALITLGHMSEAELKPMLEAYDRDQAQYRPNPLAFNQALKSHEPARVVVQIMPTLLENMAEINVKFEESSEPPPKVGVHRASVLMRGVSPLRVEICADDDLAAAIARSVSQQTASKTDAVSLNAALGEFLNVIVGNAAASLEDAGLHMSIMPPEVGGSSRGTTVLQLVATTGRGWLSLEVDPPLVDSEEGLELNVGG